MPKVEIQETAGYGGYLDGSSARIYLTDANGTIQMLDKYLTSGDVKNQLGVDRYEGKAKRTIELAFEVPVSPAARDPLRGVDWTIRFTDDTHEMGSIAITVPLDRVDLSPGD